MKDQERFRYETFLRIKQFGVDNSADFPVNTVGGTKFAQLNTVIGNLETAAANQTGGVNVSKQSATSKDTAREDLRELLVEIARTARSITYEIAGIDEKFRLPVNRNDQNMLSTARSFLTEASAYEDTFIEYEMPRDFITNLQQKIDAFELSSSNINSAIGAKIAATASIGEVIKDGMVIRRILDGVVRNKYRNDAGKLASWTSASHIEKPAKKKEEPKPQP